MSNIVSNIGEFLELLEKPRSTSPNLFRGQSNSEWELVPSLYRINSNLLSTSGKWKSIEYDILSSFKKQAFPILKEKPKTYLDWLTLGQHQLIHLSHCSLLLKT